MEEVIGKFKSMIDQLQEYIDKIDNPFKYRIYINKNKVNYKYIQDIDFRNIDYDFINNLPDNVAFCIVDKDQFDNFDDYFRKEGLM